ncbi:MAG TPA: hypothetical protein VM282_14160 [Acidimicrobiales bacterium]|nr:hypothetical protein [Acidimicrobiales bacterium]
MPRSLCASEDESHCPRDVPVVTVRALDGNPLHHDRYQRANTYDPQWVFDNQMGPNALWLLESLTEVLPIGAGARVLDLGCGRAMTSIFLAKEFGARVWPPICGSKRRTTTSVSSAPESTIS